jgi:hypothetical protein
MTIRRSEIPLVLTRVLTAITCIFLSHGIAFGQGATDPLQTDPPPVPRYQRLSPPFEVSADPTSKPLPPPVIIHDSPPDVLPPSATPPDKVLPSPTPKEVAQKQTRIQETERRDAENDRQHDRLVNIGKGVGVLVVACIGVFAAADVVRQMRKSKRSAPDEEEDEWEP